MLRDRQHAIVGQGMALGCAHLAWPGGMTVLEMESRFETAWNAWPQRKVFPGVFVHYTSWDFTNCMMVPSERRPGRRACWTDRSGSWMPQLDEGWTPQRVAELLASESRLPVAFEDWVGLARLFTADEPQPGSGVLSWAGRALRAAMPSRAA